MTYEKDAPGRLLDHVTAQRLGPVRRCIQQTLLSADDERLAAAELLEIVPRAGGRRLTVVFVGVPQHVLDRAAGWLRSELAQHLRRRRVPHLELVALDEGGAP